MWRCLKYGTLLAPHTSTAALANVVHRKLRRCNGAVLGKDRSTSICVGKAWSTQAPLSLSVLSQVHPSIANSTLFGQHKLVASKVDVSRVQPNARCSVKILRPRLYMPRPGLK
ncbi:hypothetical protein SUGI_0816140 [Cryptomeria japonica]|nr:hypothetical protein SUGI_0816140 [Cryptomeria japonica]